jgi:hypothetical protein
MEVSGRYLAVVFLCAAFAGCGGGSSTSSAGSSLPASQQTAGAAPSAQSTSGPVPAVLHTFDPAVADATITAYRNPTYAYTPISPNNGSLLIFLPGRNEAPSNYTIITQFAAASVGYHVLNLDYPNGTAPTSLCNNDPACDGNVLLQKWNGTPGNDNVTPGNSLQNRIIKELEYLAATYPSEGWNQFIIGGRVQWSNTVLAGHSLGSWESGYVSTIISVKRVVMLGGPQDVDVENVTTTVASDWLSAFSATPVTRKFTFVHVQDPSYPDSLLDSTAMGLDAFGPWTSVDGANIPFGGSHELTTDVPAANPHQSVAIDGQIPLDADGLPPFVNGWTAILTPQPGQ